MYIFCKYNIGIIISIYLLHSCNCCIFILLRVFIVCVFLCTVFCFIVVLFLCDVCCLCVVSYCSTTTIGRKPIFS
jgi:uncharacterized membrane protein